MNLEKLFEIQAGLDQHIIDNKGLQGDDLTGTTVVEKFNGLYSFISVLHNCLDVNLPVTITKEDLKEAYHDIIVCFVGLGDKHLGFNWEQIEQAYLDKNRINHERQETGY